MHSRDSAGVSILECNLKCRQEVKGYVHKRMWGAPEQSVGNPGMLPATSKWRWCKLTKCPQSLESWGATSWRERYLRICHHLSTRPCRLTGSQALGVSMWWAWKCVNVREIPLRLLPLTKIGAVSPSVASLIKVDPKTHPSAFQHFNVYKERRIWSCALPIQVVWTSATQISEYWTVKNGIKKGALFL